jgi:hypothetical protein
MHLARLYVEREAFEDLTILTFEFHMEIAN